MESRNSKIPEAFTAVFESPGAGRGLQDGAVEKREIYGRPPLLQKLKVSRERATVHR